MGLFSSTPKEPEPPPLPPRAQRCETCSFWEKNRDKELEDVEGFCHRYPPIFHSDYEYADFPETDHDDWCGEWT